MNCPHCKAVLPEEAPIPERVQREIRGLEHLSDADNWTLSVGAIRALLKRCYMNISPAAPHKDQK